MVINAKFSLSRSQGSTGLVSEAFHKDNLSFYVYYLFACVIPVHTGMFFDCENDHVPANTIYSLFWSL